MHFAAQEYGWTVDYIVDCPLVLIMLLMRQKAYTQSQAGITLQDKESLADANDEKSWEELVRANRESLRRQFGTGG